MNETIGWNCSDWSPLFEISKQGNIALTVDHFKFGGIIIDKTINFWGTQFDKQLINEYKVSAEVA